MLRPDITQQLRLRLANDIHQRHVVVDADLLQHLPQIRSRSGMDEAAVLFRRMVSTMPTVRGLTKHEYTPAAPRLHA